MMEFSQLAALVRRCTDPSGPDLYRTLYALPKDAPALDIHSWQEWESLPFLTKDHLLSKNLDERLFAPRSELPIVAASSGTSGKLPVFGSLALIDGFDFRSRYHSFSRATLASLPTPQRKQWEISQHDNGTVVALDPKRTLASVRIAQAAGVDSMCIFLFHIPAVADAMKSLGINEHIRYIEVAGEACTHAHYAYMREAFPNATIVSEYGSTDVEATPIGTPCKPIDGTEPLELFHTNDRFYLEILDEASDRPRMLQRGVEGDLVITAQASENSPLPLLRYRHGDVIRVYEESCDEHGTWSFQVLGRRDLDFVKIPGGVIRSDEIDRALRAYTGGTGLPFQLSVAEVIHANKPTVLLTLSIDGGNDVETMAQALASLIRIGPTYTLADGVRDGLFPSLRCRQLQLHTSPAKLRRIVRERDTLV